MGIQLVFVSGVTSTVPITGGAAGYLGSTTALTPNTSGSYSWALPKFDHTYRWHAYAKSGNEWSGKSAVGSLERHLDKIYLFYRNGANDFGNPTSYRVCSGGNISSWEIDLYKGGDSSECTHGGVTFRDFKGRMWWCNPNYKNITPNPDVWGGAFAIYTYPESCNSWNGGWDYWWFPNGVSAGSGSSTSDVDVTWASVSSNKAGPQVIYLKNGDTSRRWGKPLFFNVFPNGDLGCVGKKDTENGTLMVWYFSAGSWTNTLEISSANWTSNTGYDIMVASSLAAFVYCSGALEGQDCKLAVYLTSDNGRTWGDAQVIETATWPYKYFGLRPIEPRDSKTGGKLPDNIIRFGVHKGAWGAKNTNYQSGSQWIYRVNLEDLPNVLSSGMLISSGTDWEAKTKGSMATYYDGLIIVPAQVPSCATCVAYNEGYECDPRNIMWWNENTGDSGAKQFDTSTCKLWGSHCGNSTIFGAGGTIYAVGNAYYGIEGDACYHGSCMPPDICSGSTDPNDAFGERYDNVDDSGGGTGSSLFVF